MKTSIEIISEETCYYSKKTSTSIIDYKKCVDKFSKSFESEINLKTDTAIFLDTNVLLRYYSISFTARAKLFKFLKENQKRIYITTQIQTEYLRNREDIIQRFYDQVTSKIPKDFSADIVNKMKNFLDQHKVVLKDYPFVEPGIEKNRAELEALLKKLNESVELKKKEHVELIFKDELLDFLSICNQCEELTENETTLIKKHFDLLSKNLTPENVETLINKPSGAFPGLGDIKNKPDDPYGDYIIYHEIMKFMVNKKVDVIFITFDTTKGDWMSKNKSPYLHYVQNMYANSGRILYICDADRSFGELLNISVESLVSNKSENSNSITSESLMLLAKKSPAFIGAKEKSFDSEFLEELRINGYNSMLEVENDIQKFEYSILKYREKQKNLNTLGVMRIGLRIANRNYTLQVEDEEGTITKIPPERLVRYREFADLKPE